MKVIIDEVVRAAVLEHAYRCHPEEACGLLGGPDGERIATAFPTENSQASSTGFTIDPSESLRAIRSAESKDRGIVGVFHSHPHSVGYPSPIDVAEAADSEWLHLLVGMEDFDNPILRGFRIRAGTITEVELVFAS